MGQVNIGAAVAAFAPYLRAIIIEAEGTGASGPDKHAAVAEGAEALYKDLQQSGAVPALQGIDWALIAPVAIGVSEGGVQIIGGLVAVVVRLFNRLMGSVWHSFGGTTPTEAAPVVVAAPLLGQVPAAEPEPAPVAAE